MEHQFNVEIAIKYGVSAAIVLDHLAFWTLNNLANKRNIKEGLCWSYNTLDALTMIFPYWSRRQVEHLLNKMIEISLIIKGNHNQVKYDRTLWYALAPATYRFFPELCREDFYRQLYLSTLPNEPVDKVFPISQICEMEFTKFVNGFPKFVTPIPDSLPNALPDIKSSYLKERKSVDNYQNKTGEIKQMTKFWEPGNPDYDRIHAKKEH